MIPQHSNTTTIESINRTFMFMDLIDKHQPLDSESCNYIIHGGAAGAGGQPRGQDTQPLPDPRTPGHPRHRHPGLQVIFILTFSFKSFPILYDVY